MRSAIVLFILAAVYVGIVAPELTTTVGTTKVRVPSISYIDFGDGNYLYISSRLADGLVLYRDILAPQPPMHLAVGTLLIRLGRAVSDDVDTHLYIVRWFSMLLHVATMLVVFAIGRRLFVRRGTALWAAGLYLFMPLTFWWSLGYQSEPLEMLFMLLSFLFVIQWTPRSLALAGVFAALGVSTNMTAVPYVGWVTLFLLVKDWRRALWYFAPAALAMGMVIGLGEWYSGGHYLENVFFNQVGTFPHPDLMGQAAPPPGAPFRTLRTVLGYAAGKIIREGFDVLSLEGYFVLASIAGLLIYLRRRDSRLQTPDPRPQTSELAGVENSEIEAPSNPQSPIPNPQSNPQSPIPNPQSEGFPPYHRAFVGWYAFWSLMSICFVSKGATMDYIFTIGDPFVAIFAAYLLVDIGYRALGHEEETDAKRMPAPTAGTLLLTLGLLILFVRPALWIFDVVYHKTQYELNDWDVRRIRMMIENHSKPGEPIFAPPFYAFIAERPLIGEYSEMFIWDIKYQLEQKVEHTSGAATRKVRTITEALENKRIPVVVQAYWKGRSVPADDEIVTGVLTPRNPDETEARNAKQAALEETYVRRGSTYYRPQQIFGYPAVLKAISSNYEFVTPSPIETLNTSVDVKALKERVAERF